MERALIALALFASLCVTARAAGALPVSPRTLSDRNAVIDIHIAFPATGEAKIDADLRRTVDTIATGFRKEAQAAHRPNEPPYTLDVRYRIARNDARLFAVVFDDAWDFHGAHPNLEIVTANYLRAGSWRVYLPELFDGERGLKRISDLATAQLIHALLGPDAMSDPGWIARGADAHWDNFQAFVLLPDALEIEFPPYAVAAYAAGPQSVRLPLGRLADTLRPDPLKPVASFDCARAESDDERAICSDVALARLDRQVAETWSSELRAENDPGRREQLGRDQRAWLVRRDNACKATARVACLTALYRARLAALNE